jgi:hypothetical protein
VRLRELQWLMWRENSTHDRFLLSTGMTYDCSLSGIECDMALKEADMELDGYTTCFCCPAASTAASFFPPHRLGGRPCWVLRC